MDDQSNGELAMRHISRMFGAVLFAVLLAGSVSSQEPAAKIRIARLVKQLGANDYADRQQATELADKLGPQARELERATCDSDPKSGRGRSRCFRAMTGFVRALFASPVHPVRQPCPWNRQKSHHPRWPHAPRPPASCPRDRSRRRRVTGVSRLVTRRLPKCTQSFRRFLCCGSALWHPCAERLWDILREWPPARRCGPNASA